MLGLAFIILDLLTARAYLVLVTAAGVAVVFGLFLVREMMRRQRNLHRY